MKKKIKLCFIIIFLVLLGACGANVFFAVNNNNKIFANEVLPVAYCMRDDYILPTQNQDVQSLCWDFAGSEILSTAIMKHTNQYLDLSEAYVSLISSISRPSIENPTVNPGASGSINVFNDACESFGVVLDQDFSYETSYWLTKENSNDFYNFYKQYADFEIFKNYEKIKYPEYKTSSGAARTEAMNKIKNHILNYSAVLLSSRWTSSFCVIDDKRIYFKDPTTTAGGMHDVPIIGWDDNLSVNVNNTIYKGAWIILNSYGNTSGDGGVFYVFYDDIEPFGYVGYKYVENPNCNFEITSVNSNAVCNVNFKGKYYGNLESETAQTKQKNIFYNTNNIALNYDYKANNGYSIKQIDVYNLGNTVTDRFNITYNNNSFSISSSNCNIGTYKVKITLTNGEEEIFSNTAFYVCDGNEIESVKYMGNDINLSTGQGKLQCVGNLNANAGDLIYYLSNKTGNINFQFTFNTYSLINNISLGNSDFTELSFKDTGVNISYDLDQNNAYSVRFKHDDVIREYIINIFYVEDTNSEIVVLNYDLNGGVNNSQNLKRGLISNSKNIELYEPTREGYEFKGWYTSPTFEENSKLAFENNKYILKNSDVIRYNTNTVAYQSSYDLNIKKSNVAFLYAKWDEEHNPSDNNTGIVTSNNTVETVVIFIVITGVVGFIVYVGISSRRKFDI